jgi:hypothetical protein
MAGSRLRRQRGRDPFLWLAAASSAVIVAFILVPLVEMMTQPTLASLKETLMDRDVVRAIRLSIVTSGSAALIAMLFGTPLAYLLARRSFPGKQDPGKRDRPAHHDSPPGGGHRPAQHRRPQPSHRSGNAVGRHRDHGHRHRTDRRADLRGTALSTSTRSRPASRRSHRDWSMSPAAWVPRPAPPSSG